MTSDIIPTVVRNGRRTFEELGTDNTMGASTAPGLLIAVIAGLAAAWIAAGSTGLLAHPLRRMLILTALVVVIFSPSPLPWRGRKGFFSVLITIVLAVCMTASSLPVVNVMSVSFVLASLAITFSGPAKKMLCIVSAAVGVFGLYRMTCTGIPLVWSITDKLGSTIGKAGGLISGQPTYVGATFAGLDFLVLISVFWILWVTSSPEQRRKGAIYGFAAIIGGHICYLIVLSYVPQLLSAVAEPVEKSVWSWRILFHKAIPWNLPMLAFVIHLLIASAMFRWSTKPVESEPNYTKSSVTFTREQNILRFGAIVMAILFSIIIALYPGKSDLKGKKIVFYEKGFLNWLKPTHGQYGRLSSGMYGMLPIFIESLGARSLISADLSEKDLQDADALALLFPDEPWAEDQLKRIWDFVHRGGSLLVMGEHTTRDENGKNRFNEVLKPTSMQVEFDSATFAVGGWLQSYDAITHPATIGVPDDRNQFGVVIGASLKTSWSARPLLIGRWGWSDMGDEGSGRAMMGNSLYDSSEKLGDLILAAEQPLGRGRVIAFGDTSSLTNGINVSSYVFTSRLLGYLAGGRKSAHPIWRQLLGILSCIVLITLLIRRTIVDRIILITICLSGSLVFCNVIGHGASEIHPDGRYKQPNNLAFIDTSHLAANSGESWRPDGIGGFILTLMRNGYLTLSLPELTAERLVRSDLLVSIAPSRSFSKTEQAAIREFILNGGKFVFMAGLDRAGPSSSLLSMLGFSIGNPESNPVEPEAMGHFKSPYLKTPSGDKRVHVRFHAAWPVTCNDPSARVIANGHNDLPVIILRQLGAGKVVVIGDTCFVENKNLEWEGGEPFEGMRENADFWRWFITQLRDQDMWIPPALRSEPESIKGRTTQDNPKLEVAN